MKPEYRFRETVMINQAEIRAPASSVAKVIACLEAEFGERVDEAFEAVEYALDEVDSDLDYEAGGGVLTVTFENGTTMVFSRQPPVRQLWLAARSGGFHYQYDAEAGDWRNTRDGSLFRPFVVEQMKIQGEIDFRWL